MIEASARGGGWSGFIVHHTAGEGGLSGELGDGDSSIDRCLHTQDPSGLPVILNLRFSKKVTYVLQFKSTLAQSFAHFYPSLLIIQSRVFSPPKPAKG